MRCISCLTTALFRLKIPPILGNCLGRFARQTQESMNPPTPAPTSSMSSQVTQCKHPRVKIVAREDDAEFVECLECGDIFESSEFEDMSIEERTQGSEL